jgi:hypothetical protein
MTVGYRSHPGDAACAVPGVRRAHEWSGAVVSDRASRFPLGSQRAALLRERAGQSMFVPGL